MAKPLLPIKIASSAMREFIPWQALVLVVVTHALTECKCNSTALCSSQPCPILDKWMVASLKNASLHASFLVKRLFRNNKRKMINNAQALPCAQNHASSLPVLHVLLNILY